MSELFQADSKIKWNQSQVAVRGKGLSGVYPLTFGMQISGYTVKDLGASAQANPFL